MYPATKEQLIWITETLERHIEAVDISKTFYSVLTRSVASKIATELLLPYDKAVVIATCLKIDVDVRVENEKEQQLVDNLANVFVKSLIQQTQSFFDDGSYDIEVMKNIASQMNVSL